MVLNTDSKQVQDVEPNNKKYAYSEIFYSPQGEGHYTGYPTVWLRTFLCNLQCDGFGQDDPTDESTYDLPYQDINVEDYDVLEDLPVFSKGCDTSYSWSKKFAKLQHKGTPVQIAERIIDKLKNNDNLTGKFLHPKSGFKQHLCFTGGEPLMSHGQECSIGVIRALKKHDMGLPGCITYETNGTQKLSEAFKTFYINRGTYAGDLFFSVSPKLRTVSGEKREKAIKPEIVKEYETLSREGITIQPHGQLKFVMTPELRAWDELDEVIGMFRSHGVSFPVWIMPVGARVEEQEITAGRVATMAMQRGYHVSARVHTYLWGNKIGT
jgi:organic radical activating enzyme